MTFEKQFPSLMRRPNLKIKRHLLEHEVNQEPSFTEATITLLQRDLLEYCLDKQKVKEVIEGIRSEMIILDEKQTKNLEFKKLVREGVELTLNCILKELKL